MAFPTLVSFFPSYLLSIIIMLAIVCLVLNCCTK